MTKWFKWAPIVAIILSIKSGVKANLFVAVLAVMLVGTVFGGPAGMMVGTITGHFRQKKCPRAPDAVPEGAEPYLIGMVLPAIFLGVLIPFYFLWLTPKMIEWF